MALKIDELRSNRLSLTLKGTHNRNIKERPSLIYFFGKLAMEMPSAGSSDEMLYQLEIDW